MKVFCIGFHKTGSSSLAKALDILGFGVCRRFGALRKHFPEAHFAGKLINNDVDLFLEVVPLYDAFCDNPWPHIYKELDKQFPNSKFILTIRDEDNWIRSVLSYFGDSDSELRKWIYGFASPVENEERYLQTYKKHNEDVMEHFRGEEGRLLVLDFEKGSGWKELCAFLERPVPPIGFPHSNKTPTVVSAKRKLNSKSVFQADLNEKLLLLEALVTLALCRGLILLFPFRKIAGLLGKATYESSFEIENDAVGKAKSITLVLESLSPRLPFRSMCFEQALALKLMLNRRGISSTIYFGLSKDKDDHVGLKAHAWTRSGRHYLTGKKGKETFKAVAYFGT